MKITMNLKSSFEPVEEGERILKITKAECTPSGKPNKAKVTFQDTVSKRLLTEQYDFTNNMGIFKFSKLCEVALGLEDEEEFDTKTDTPKLVDCVLLCDVSHSEGTKPNEEGNVPVFAHVKKVISKVDENGEVESGDTEQSPRNAIAEQEDELDLDDLD